MKKKCYIYTRVSTAVQTEGYSLDAQLEKLHAYAEYKGLRIAGEYCDAGKSGHTIKGRPAFMQMMDDIICEKDGVSYVLVFKLSRFGRNAADVLKSMQLLNDYDVDLVSVDDAIDSSTQGGKLTLSILSAVAEIERENITAQFMAGKEQRIMNGDWPGGPAPYGYRIEDKKLVTVPEEAEIVKLIYELYRRDDMMISTIMNYLKEHGYHRTVKGQERIFDTNMIRTILDNPIYCGRISYNRRTNNKDPNYKQKPIIEVKGKHEPLVDEETWERLQVKRKQSSRGCVKKDSDRVSLLSGLVKCPACGGGMICKVSRAKNKNHGGYYKTMYSYGCRANMKQAGRICSFNHTYNQEKLDAAVMDVIKKVVAMPEFIEAVDQMAGAKTSGDEIEAKMKVIRKELHTFEHQKFKLGDGLDHLDILADDYDEAYEQIQTQLDRIYDQIDDKETELASVKRQYEDYQKNAHAIDKIRLLLLNLDKLFEKMTYEERREMMRIYIERIEVFPEELSNGRILKSITFNIPIEQGDPEKGKRKTDDRLLFSVDCTDMAPSAAEAKATYVEIKAYVLEKFGLKVSSLYIAQIKRKYGTDMRKNYNLAADPDKHVPKCPRQKEEAIMEALKHFKMLDETVELIDDMEGKHEEAEMLYIHQGINEHAGRGLQSGRAEGETYKVC